MGSALLSVVFIGIATAILPFAVIIVLFLLRGEGGLPKAVAFVAGSIAVRIVQGIVFGYIFVSSADSHGESSSDLVTSTLLLVLGILLLIAAFKKWRKEEDPDAPPPKWMITLSVLSTAKAFGLGALLTAVSAKQWVFTLSAIGVIAEAPLSPVQDVLVFLVYVLVAALLVLLPIIVCAVAPKQSARTLAAAQKWLEDHNSQIMIMASLVFGLLFLYKGISGLLG